MDVFVLSRHEYLQPPMPKHGRNQLGGITSTGGSSSGIGSSGTGGGSGSGNGGNNQGGGSSQQAQTPSFSTGLFGNMNQSSSS